MVLCRFGHQSWGDVKQGKDEFVGVLRFYVELLKGLGRKVHQIAGDDDARFGVDGGCQYMPVPLVRQNKARNEVLISGYERIRRCLIHELPGTLQLLAREVRAVL